MRDKKKKPKKMSIKLCGLLLGFCIAAGLSIGIVYAEDTDNRKLQNGSFEEEQSWDRDYLISDQGSVPAWNTTASDGKIELFRENTKYIQGVTLKPTAGNIAAELNANEESTLYQNVATTPASIYEWGLDHGARNYADTMALVIGPKQTVDPSKQDTNNDGNPDKGGRDQLMQMVDWLIDQGKTSVKTTAGLGEHLVVYSKKFAANGTFENNSGNNAFSLTPSSVYTEEWHVWIIADRKATSGKNPWGRYGSNAEGTAGSTDESSGTDVDMDKSYRYTVPSGQNGTLFGFVSVGGVTNASGAPSTDKTYGNFLDNVNFKIFHPLSGSTTLHGSGVVGGSDGTTTGEGSSIGYEVTVDKNLITYAVDGEPLRIQAVVKKDDAYAGCEFVGLYYTIQDASGKLVTTFLQKAGKEIDYRDDLTDEEKKDKWIKSSNSNGDIIYTYYLSNITTATDLHFIFIKSPTVTYDPNGGKEYIVEKNYNTDEAKNVYSFKPVVNEGSYTFIPPYRSNAAEGQNDGWKFMGWLLTGDTVATIPVGTSQINADKLGTLLLPAKHTIVCDYTVGDKEQYFKIWKDDISLTENTNNSSYVKWETGEKADYANVHKGLTMVAQWRWRQAFIPQLNSAGGYEDSNVGGTVEIISVTDKLDTNYNGKYNAYGGKSYHAATDEIVTATATANEGYEFVGWYDEGGKLLTTKTTYSFTEIKEKVSTYYARFEKTVTQTYIRQVKDGNTWSVIEGDQNSSVGNLDRYTYTDVVGKQISATAAAGEGYKFIGWYDLAGNSVAAEMLSADKATLRYTTTGEATYYARFEKTVTQKFVRQVKNGDGWTNTSDDSIATLNPYTHTDVVGATASSKATVGEGYKFVGWYDAEGEPVADGMLNADKTTIRYTTTGDATYYARFEKTVTQTFIRQVKNGDNWEETTDDSIGTLNSYTHTDVVGARASSTATAGEGYEFVGWCDGEGNPVGAEKLSDDGRTISYVTTGDATYYARFRRTASEENVTQTFVRQVEVGESWEETTDDSIGTLNSYTHTDVVGATASSTATAGEGYEFVGWYDVAGNQVGAGSLSDDGRTISYVTTGDATYYARFRRTASEENVTQTFVRQVEVGESWEETTDDSIGTLNSYTHTDVVGATASSTATAGEGYEFVGWYDVAGNQVGAGSLSDDGRTISYVTTGDATYYARFRRTASEENVTQTFVRQVEDGETWEETTDDSIGTLNSYTHTDVVGATASSTATAGEGYEFVGWYDVAGNQVGAGSLSGDGRTISYVTTGDATYYARFRMTTSEENVTQTFVRQVEDGETWEETTDDSIGTLNSYTHTDVVGATASSTATAGEGYEFVGWYDVAGNQVGAGSLSGDGRTISYVTTGDATYYARFRMTTSEENVTQTFVRQVEDGETWEETTDDSIGTLNSYTHTDVVGATASSTATAGEGYEFVGWYDVAGNQVGAGSLSDDGRTISYVTTGDATYYARFRMTTSEENVTQTFVRQVEVGESWEETTDDSIGTLNSYTHTDVVGATASSTAAAGEGYEFVGWYDVAGNQVGAGSLSGDGRTISYVTTGDATYYARFRRTASEENVTQTFVRQVEDGETWEETTDDSIGILTLYNDTDVVGKEVSSTAAAGEGYEFVGWYDEEGNPVGEDKLSDEGRTLSYATTGNATYYARFSRIIVTQTYIRQVKNGDNWEETTDDNIGTLNSYTHTDVVGATASSTATAGTGYKFEGWYDEEGNPVGEDKLSDEGRTLSYAITGNATYYARFSRIIVTQTYIRQVKNGDNWEETSNDSIGTLSSYTHSGGVGETAGSKATAGEGYEFVGWYDSEGKKVEKDKLSSNGKALSYRTIGNATYYARFKKSASEENLTQTNNPKIEDEETEDDTISVENMIQTKVNQVKNGETLKDASKDISKDTSNDTPQTGDDSNPALWLTLMLLSMSALEGLFIRKKKDRK